MSKIGRLSEFEVAHPEHWNSYVAWVENYFKVNQIREDGLKVATLLCVCRQETFDIAENLVAPALLESVTYADLKKMLKEHFQPKLSVIAWRHTFEQRDQRPGESAVDFIAALRQAARPCEFKDLKRGCGIICGLRSHELQQKIFAKEDVSFQDALKEVAADEAAGSAVNALQLARNPPATMTVHQEVAREDPEQDPEEDVDRLHQPAERRLKEHPDRAPASPQCFGCGERRKRADCRFRSAICQACDVLVSDNGPQFTCFEFQAFLQANLIRHTTSAPFHPSSNGQAERMVRTTKDALKRHMAADITRLADFLLVHCTTPCTATGKSPTELCWGRRLITKLGRLHPDQVASQVSQPCAPSTLQVGDPIWARNYGPGHLWLIAVVCKVSGPLSYEVALDDGCVI
ncbi:hypothetical protein NXF25_015196 [Crotalus adamanteus]|uniref:Integrase catalytic domain-containing protein n=1 Tax=Crotalus adamanteus TaxID=8729 RepID=A0AAW1AYM2_CROAD